MDATFTPLFSTVYSANTKRKALIEIGHPKGWPFLCHFYSINQKMPTAKIRATNPPIKSVVSHILEFPSPEVGVPQDDDDRRDGYHGTHQHQDFPQR